MTWGEKRVLAVVPARGGSKSIPRKNLRIVGGISLIARAARVAASLPWLDAAVISTDDEEMAAEAVANGIDAPFLRPDDLATDTAAPADVWRHAWLESERHYAMRFDVSILLEPTSPLRRAEDVEMTVGEVIDKNKPAAATVSPTPAHYTPYKTLTLTDSQTIGFYVENGQHYAIRQRIPEKFYHRNGLCYATTREVLVDRGHIIDESCHGVIIDRPIANIDESFELELADWLLSREGK